MDIKKIFAELDSEIAQLKYIRSLLSPDVKASSRHSVAQRASKKFTVHSVAKKRSAKKSSAKKTASKKSAKKKTARTK